MAGVTPLVENYYGWDLLHKTIESSLKKNADILVALAHFVLTKDVRFRCLGVGESKTLEENEIGSELLPDDWNVDERKYALRYAYDKDLYILLGHITEGALIMNFLNIQNHTASNVRFEPDTVVQSLNGTLFDIIPSAAASIRRIRKELVLPEVAVVNSDLRIRILDYLQKALNKLYKLIPASNM